MAFKLNRWHLLHDLRVTLMLLTRLPLPPVHMEDQSEAAEAAWSFPLAGAVLALGAGLIATAALVLGLPPGIAAGLALASLIVMSGALHEDGLADCADGFWGGMDKTRRLEIMRDSRIGAYGVLGLVLVTGLRWSAYGALFLTGDIFAPLIVAAMVSRTAMVGVMGLLPNARGDGLSHSSGRPEMWTMISSAILAALAAIAFFGGLGLLILAVALAVGWICARIAKAKIDGQTGDVLGATQQITELAVLLTLVASL